MRNGEEEAVAKMHDDSDGLTLDGDWQEVEKLCTKPLVKNHRSFLYSIYKQQYLEYIERREVQKVKAWWLVVIREGMNSYFPLHHRPLPF